MISGTLNIFKAQHGKPGSKRNKTGANGEDLILKVPLGTQVYEEDNNTLIYDFTKNKKNILWHRVVRVDLVT